MNMIHMINRYLGEMENSRMIRMIDKFGNACSRNIYQWKLYFIFWDSLSSLTQNSHAKIGLPALSGRGNLHVGTFICAQVFVESGIFTTWRFRHVFNLTPGWLYWQVNEFFVLEFFVDFKIFKLLQMFHQVDQARLTIRTQYPALWFCSWQTKITRKTRLKDMHLRVTILQKTWQLWCWDFKCYHTISYQLLQSVVVATSKNRPSTSSIPKVQTDQTGSKGWLLTARGRQLQRRIDVRRQDYLRIALCQHFQFADRNSKV